MIVTITNQLLITSEARATPGFAGTRAWPELSNKGLKVNQNSSLLLLSIVFQDILTFGLAQLSFYLYIFKIIKQIFF